MNVSGPEKLLYITVGILLLALGLVGLLIPIIPGTRPPCARAGAECQY